MAHLLCWWEAAWVETLPTEAGDDTHRLSPSTFSQPGQASVLAMGFLLGVELCVLVGFVAYGWGPEGYRSWQRRKRRSRRRVGNVRPEAAFVVARQRAASRNPRS
jgi:hypothetical protein